MIVILSLIPNEKDIFSEIILSIKKKTKSMAFYLFDQKTVLFKLIHCPCYAEHNA